MEGTPVVAGRPVERLVSLKVIHVNHALLTRGQNKECWILPGQFVPVSEDADGVYFQGLNGLKTFAGNREPQPVPGGVYLSKTSDKKIYRYFGDARTKDGLDVDAIPISLIGVLSLQVAHIERKK